MPVVKGGVWTNIEDEILKASVSKYGLNQWARVSSLLARKTPKQCKARWTEWLDPGIRKIEWSKEEDEKLLHLAKLMPTQWRTIAPIVGRTATQCLERYQRLLDDAEQRESAELGLGGPEGGETQAPSADDVRRLRPGEVDPDPESKPARPDTIDMDEDEKEMLSEARARLANTQGKKAKRKARERQLEESRRLATLQKRRELKAAGINIKVTTRKAGQMDYNADIPFEKQPASGFYDTQEELAHSELERSTFDPRKQQLANKRKNDQKDDDGEHKKRRKEKEGEAPSAAFAAAAKAGQMQKMREAERSSRRRALNLPVPQVSEGELEDIVKMGMAGERASLQAGQGDNNATRGLVGDYSNRMVGQTPIRTPRAAQEDDRIANELRNARARTETQSALLGGENPDLVETTGYTGATPSRSTIATPNPLATPFRQTNGAGSSTAGPGATPGRTPRDTFSLNQQTPGSMILTGQTPREIKLARQAQTDSLRSKLAAIPAPKETDFELEIPQEQEEQTARSLSAQKEDAAVRDERDREARLAAERADFARQTQVIQRSLPRPSTIDFNALIAAANAHTNPAECLVAHEAALLIANDAQRFGKKVSLKGTPAPLASLSDDDLQRARLEIALELDSTAKPPQDAFDAEWDSIHQGLVPGLAAYAQDEVDSSQMLTAAFEALNARLTGAAEASNALEKKLALHLGGYQARAKTLRGKMLEAGEALEATRRETEVSRIAAMGEDAAIRERLEALREEVQGVMGRERRAQEEYRSAVEELRALGG